MGDSAAQAKEVVLYLMQWESKPGVKAFSLLTQVSIFILCPCSAKGEHRNNLPDLWVPLLQLQDLPGWSSSLTQEHTGVQDDWQSWEGNSENGDSWATVP